MTAALHEDPKDAIDPLTLAVVRQKLLAVTEEIVETMVRTCFSPLLNQSRDLSAVVLDGDNVVAFAVNTFACWDYPATVLSGDAPLPLPGENTDGGQAVCLVGYEDNPALPGGGAFIIHNSWGTGWGEKNRYGAGYGTLSYAYAALYGLEAYTIEG